MTADALLTALTQALYFVIFIVVCVRAVRQRARAAVDTAIFFGALALIIADQWITELAVATPPWWISATMAALLMALPYLLLRLVEDFGAVPRLVMRAAEVGLLLSIVGLYVTTVQLPLWAAFAMVLYFAGFEIYGAVKFVTAARQGSGVTRRRMQAAAAGCALLGAVIVVAGGQLLLPSWEPVWLVLSRLGGLASGVAYFVAFAPPAWLRRAWQEPELRSFLARVASLPRLPDITSVARALEDGTSASVGAPHAVIGFWDAEKQVLRFQPRAGPNAGREVEIASGAAIVGRAFAQQRAIFSADAGRDDPATAAAYQASHIRSLLVAPITAGAQRLGVLVVYSPQAPIFADEDLGLLRLLAAQAAVILESRALIDEAASVRAREEAARLKEDFLSAAAHDLKTPLTTLVAQAQLLERRARRRTDAAADLQGIERIVREAIRLRDLVLELLDASRVEEGRLSTTREPIDLAALARQRCEHHRERECILEMEGPVVGEYDQARMVQLLDNLIDNAIKYSPSAAPVTVRVGRSGSEALLSVQDRGIGIPAADLPHVFDRFYRGTNVDDRRFAGMGLGLYICHGIVMEHGGRIWVESQSGMGSTFHVALPLPTEARAAEPVAVGVQR